MEPVAAMSLRDKMFSFEGRLRRADYWFISIAMGVSVFAVTEILMWSIFGSEYSLLAGGYEADERRVAAVWPCVVQILVSVTTFWPSLAISAKRAHDRNKSAVTIIGILVAFEIYAVTQPVLMGWLTALTVTPVGLAVNIGLILLSLVGAVYIFVVVGCLDGTPGPNRFGPSPKAHELADAKS